MGFHYGYEKRKFDAEWTRLEQEYRAAGMDDRQIAAMKEYDWTWFCSQRTYQNRVQALPSEQCEDESEQSCLFRKFESLSCTWDAHPGGCIQGLGVRGNALYKTARLTVAPGLRSSRCRQRHGGQRK